MRKNLDLMVAILIVVLNVGWVQLPNRPVLISVILVLPLVLILPGYALTQALFRKGSPSDGADQALFRSRSSDKTPEVANPLRLGHPIGKADHFILSLGLSMAIAILVGFVLNILPIGLQAISWVFSLGFLTVLCALLALFTRRRDVVATPGASRFRLTLPDILFLGLAVFIIINAIWLAAIKPPVPQPSFTQLWMLPANAANHECAVSLGVQSFELSSMKYYLTVTVNNQQVTGNWSAITLVPQQKWVQLVPVTPEAQNDLHVTAQLYRSDQPSTAYRNVHLTFHVSTQFQNGQAQLQCRL